jgi:hypothetical protein
MVPHVVEDGTAEEYYPGDVVPTILIDPKTGRQVERSQEIHQAVHRDDRGRIDHASRER